MIDEQKVRTDLRRLRKLTHSIESMLAQAEIHRRRISFLRENGQGEEEIRHLQDLIRQMDIVSEIEKETQIEKVYMRAIYKLDPIDRAIILDGFVGGKPYWKIGRDVGLSEDGVKAHVKKAIARIAREL